MKIILFNFKICTSFFGRSASIELGEFNILVNTVSPGFVNTEMTSENLNEAD